MFHGLYWCSNQRRNQVSQAHQTGMHALLRSSSMYFKSIPTHHCCCFDECSCFNMQRRILHRKWCMQFHQRLLPRGPLSRWSRVVSHGEAWLKYCVWSVPLQFYADVSWWMDLGKIVGSPCCQGCNLLDSTRWLMMFYIFQCCHLNSSFDWRCFDIMNVVIASICT